MADQNREVEAVFEASQGKGIERALRGTRFVAQTAPASPVSPYYGSWDAPNDLTPGSDIPLTVALALLMLFAMTIAVLRFRRTLD